MKDPNLPRRDLALGHSRCHRSLGDTARASGAETPSVKDRFENKKLLPLGKHLLCVFVLLKNHPCKEPGSCSSSSSSSFPAVLPFPVSIPMSPLCACPGAVLRAACPGLYKRRHCVQDRGRELSAVTLPQPKVDPMCCGSDGGVPPAPSQPAPPENQTPKGAEMCFPRELWSLRVVDGGQRLPQCCVCLKSHSSSWGTLMGVPFQHCSSQLFGGVPL